MTRLVLILLAALAGAAAMLLVVHRALGGRGLPEVATVPAWVIDEDVTPPRPWSVNFDRDSPYSVTNVLHPDPYTTGLN